MKLTTYKKYILIAVLFSIFQSCGIENRKNTNIDTLPTVEAHQEVKTTADSIVDVKPRVTEDIPGLIWKNPPVAFATKHSENNHEHNDVIQFHFEDTLIEQYYPDFGLFKAREFEVDTFRFGNGKLPGLIILDRLGMWAMAGWGRSVLIYSIWDLNNGTELFYAIKQYEYESKEIKLKDENEEVSPEDEYEEMEMEYERISNCTWNYDITIDSISKRLVLENLVETYEGECMQSPDKKMGTYQLKDGKFQLLKFEDHHD
ncbi:MAG: hypothetical protein K9H64_02175 [Bacteroidales bacterium]|nr:hypothetical protein [Bacteroidales bacterium]MCF8454646.1 hypothetical protein [Bacteroidales bacterium]